MHDELNAILRLYGESGTEGAPDPPTESEDLAAVKAALDHLPQQRPDPSVIDAVVAAAAEAARAAALGPIRAVYDEAPEPLVSEQAEAEAVAFASMKAALDALPPQRPDASVIAAVLAAASSPQSVPAVATVGRAADRPAQRSTRRRVVTALSAVFAVVLVFGGGLWMNRDAATPQEAVAERFEAEADIVAEAPSDAKALAGAAPEAAMAAELGRQRGPSAPPAPPPQAAAPASANRSALADDATRAEADRADLGVAAVRRVAPDPVPSAGVPAAEALAPAIAADELAEGAMLASEETLPLADGDEELQLLYLRVREMQAAQAGLGWDTPPISLGAAPDSTPAATGWMQVRVQR